MKQTIVADSDVNFKLFLAEGACMHAPPPNKVTEAPKFCY